MKWTSHRITTLALVYALTRSIPAAAIAALGSVFPDAVEGHGDRDNPLSEQHRKWQARHRQTSHWFVIYAVVGIVSFVYAGHHNPKGLDMARLDIEGLISISAAWFSVGCLAHILEDLFCGKVPGLMLKQRIGWQFFYLGTYREYMIVVGTVAVSLSVIFIRGDIHAIR